MPVLDHFNLIAPFYDRLIKPVFPEKLVKLLEIPRGAVLVDVGGGTGRVAQFFLDSARTVIVADISFGMLAQARDRHRLAAVCSASEVLPFADNSIDRISLVDVFHHVIDQRQTCRELWRVLKPGGRLVIEEPDIRSLAVILIALAEKMALMRSRFLSPAQISDCFAINGAQPRAQLDSHTAWIVVDKPSGY